MCNRICVALASIKNDYIKCSLSEEELASKKADFRRKFKMPSIIGAIDCTDIRIKKVLGEYGQLYINFTLLTYKLSIFQYLE